MCIYVYLCYMMLFYTCFYVYVCFSFYVYIYVYLYYMILLYTCFYVYVCYYMLIYTCFYVYLCYFMLIYSWCEGCRPHHWNGRFWGRWGNDPIFAVLAGPLPAANPLIKRTSNGLFRPFGDQLPFFMPLEGVYFDHPLRRVILRHTRAKYVKSM